MPAAASSWMGGRGSSADKPAKARGRIAVKPILKKLQPSSEKNSLDLDRGWEDQLHNWSAGPSSLLDYSSAIGSRSLRDVTFASPDTSGDVAGASMRATPIVSPDVAKHSPGGPAMVPGTAAAAAAVRPKFQHARSPSCASHISVATTGSGGHGRAGFVHPFQQTPRTATPPLPSYATSTASFDAARDYSPTITEHDDDELHDAGLLQQHSHPHRPRHGHSHSQSSLRRPSLASQRTSSLSDMHTAGQNSLQLGSQPAYAASGPRLNSTRASSITMNSRKTHKDKNDLQGLSRSQSDLRLNLTLSTSLHASDLPGNSPSHTLRSHYNTPSTATTTFPVLASPVQSSLISPTSSLSAAPLSPLRSSLEMVGSFGPRLRSLSEQQSSSSSRLKKPSISDPVEHARLIREARAKFNERQRVKEEKFARKQERAQNKEAEKQERRIMQQQTKESEKQQRDLERHIRQEESLYAGDEQPRPGTSASSTGMQQQPDWRRQYVRQGLSVTPPPGPLLSEKDRAVVDREKYSLASSYSNSVYDRTATRTSESASTAPPSSSAPHQQGRRRGSSSAKRKTHGYWTNVILWIRTKLFKLSRGD